MPQLKTEEIAFILSEKIGGKGGDCPVAVSLDCLSFGKMQPVYMTKASLKNISEEAASHYSVYEFSKSPHAHALVFEPCFISLEEKLPPIISIFGLWEKGVLQIEQDKLQYLAEYCLGRAFFYYGLPFVFEELEEKKALTIRPELALYTFEGIEELAGRALRKQLEQCKGDYDKQECFVYRDETQIAVVNKAEACKKFAQRIADRTLTFDELNMKFIAEQQDIVIKRPGGPLH